MADPVHLAEQGEQVARVRPFCLFHYLRFSTIGDFSISNCHIVQNFESIEKYFNILIEGRGNIGLL